MLSSLYRITFKPSGSFSKKSLIWCSLAGFDLGGELWGVEEDFCESNPWDLVWNAAVLWVTSWWWWYARCRLLSMGSFKASRCSLWKQRISSGEARYFSPHRKCAENLMFAATIILHKPYKTEFADFNLIVSIYWASFIFRFFWIADPSIPATEIKIHNFLSFLFHSTWIRMGKTFQSINLS